VYQERNLLRLKLAARAAFLVPIMLLAMGATGPAASQPAPPPAVDAPPQVIGSGLPLPRYVSLKSDRVNLRSGPGTDYPTSWVYRRAGLPVEVIKEFEGWRQVRDADGVTGWVLQSLLSGRRTGIVLPWELKGQTVKPPQVALHVSDSERSRTLALIEAGVIASVHSCDGRWCEVSVEKLRGYIEQKKLWGVYEREVVK
jgi:SH3-like domain-containing protein